jgi:hypothetical protein
MAVDDGPAFFGSVTVSVPESQDAGRLLKRCAYCPAIPQFSELKRERPTLTNRAYGHDR